MKSPWRLGTYASAMITAALTMWSLDARADCKNDSECKGDRVCEQGKCVSPPPPPAAIPPSAPPVAPSAPLPPPGPAANGQAPLAPDAVRVSIESKRGDHVSLDGKTSSDCRAPCTLSVAPGRYTLRGKDFERDVDIPPNQVSRIEMKRGCTACWILGGILTPVGIPFIVGGAALHGEGDHSTRADEEDLMVAGAAMVVSGVLMSTAGIVFLILGGASGGSSATVNGREASAPAPVSPGLGLHGKGLVFRF